MLKSPKLEIQSDSLEKIAKYAAEQAARKHKRLVVVEDSGLFVEALDGFPGPYSSYVHATIGCEGILRLMRNENRRYAYFQASLALAAARKSVQSFSGKVYGTISRQILGKSGFGFDPIFIPEGTQATFAQGGTEFKMRYSHRSKAFRKLAKMLLDPSLDADNNRFRSAES